MTVRRRGLPRPFALVVCVAALGAAGAALPALAFAADRSPGDDALALSVTTYGPNVLRPGEPLLVGTSVSNSSPDPVLDAVASVSITVDPITDRTVLDPWASGDLDLPTRLVAQATPGGATGISPSGSVAFTLVASPDSLGLPAGTSGVYGVEVDLQHAGVTVRSVYTFVTWLDAVPAATPVSVVVLASGSPERIDALLATAGQSGVTFAVDPTAASAEAVSQLAGLETLLLPARNIDVASLAHAGNANLLDHALALSRTAAQGPLATAPWLAVVPDVDDSIRGLAIERGADAILVVPTFSESAPDLAGFSGTVPPGVAVDGAEPTGPLLLFPDSALSAALVAGPPGSAITPARVVAETALLSAGNTAGNPVIAVAGPSWSIESDHRSGTLSALLTSPWVRITPLQDTLAPTAPRATATVPSTVSSSTQIPGTLIAAAGASVRGLDALAAATADPAGLEAAPLDALLTATAFDRRTDPAARDAALQSAITSIDTLRSSVAIPAGSTLNLISSSGKIPVTITNALETDVTVRVVLQSGAPILRIEDQPLVTLAPGASQQILVPVTAISSGNVVVDVSLANADGARLTPVTEVALRIHAQWGNAFTLGVAALGLLLLVAGTARTLRRGRAETRLGPSDLPPDEDA